MSISLRQIPIGINRHVVRVQWICNRLKYELISVDARGSKLGEESGSRGPNWSVRAKEDLRSL